MSKRELQRMARERATAIRATRLRGKGMITVYVSEQRGGRIKLTTDKDCLPPDAISERIPSLP